MSVALATAYLVLTLGVAGMLLQEAFRLLHLANASRHGLCVFCDYELGALAACPECGRAASTAPKSPDPLGWTPRRVAVVFAAVALGVLPWIVHWPTSGGSVNVTSPSDGYTLTFPADAAGRPLPLWRRPFTAGFVRLDIGPPAVAAPAAPSPPTGPFTLITNVPTPTQIVPAPNSIASLDDVEAGPALAKSGLAEHVVKRIARNAGAALACDPRTGSKTPRVWIGAGHVVMTGAIPYSAIAVPVWARVIGGLALLIALTTLTHALADRRDQAVLSKNT